MKLVIGAWLLVPGQDQGRTQAVRVAAISLDDVGTGHAGHSDQARPVLLI
jgi:hypothetical protein